MPDERDVFCPSFPLDDCADKDGAVFGVGSGYEAAIGRPAACQLCLARPMDPDVHRRPAHLRRRKKVPIPDSEKGFETVRTHCQVLVLQTLTVLSSDYSSQPMLSQACLCRLRIYVPASPSTGPLDPSTRP